MSCDSLRTPFLKKRMWEEKYLLCQYFLYLYTYSSPNTKLTATTVVTEVHIIGCLFFLRFYLFILDRGEGKEKKRKSNINVWLPLTAPYWGPDQICNPSMCPDWGVNQQPFGSQAAADPLSHTNQD